MDFIRADDGAAAFDFRRLGRISDGDREFEREVVGEFLKQAHEALAELAGAIASDDVAAIRRLAHTLKGSSRTVGAEALGTAGARLEQLAIGADAARRSAALDQAQAALAAAENALDGYFGSDDYRKAA